MKQDDPPLKPKLLGIALFGVYLIATMPIGAPLENGVLGNLSLSIIQETTLLPLSVPPQKSQVLASLVEDIIYCESKGDPTAENPKSTAYGLCQFLDGTWEYVQEKWAMELDRDDPNDQLYACERLLEEEGLSHWEPVWRCLNNKD